MRKKAFVALLLIITVLFSGCVREAYNNEDVAFFGSEPGASASANVSSGPAGQSADWTVMIYLNGSNLESENGEATRNLQSLLSVDLPENICVLIYTGGTALWQNDLISPDRNQIWRARGGELELLESIEPQSMGESATLAEFITYGQAYAPYGKKALLMWDHGSGSVQGFGVDELFNSDGLFLYEMAEAMAVGSDGVPFDLIGFDACLMASIETASVFAPYADTLVASEEVEPGGGWDYSALFGALASDPGMTGEELGIAITDTYYAKYVNTPTEGFITCSVIDLEKIPALETLLGEYSQGLSGSIAMPAALQTLSSARQNTEAYGEEPGAVSFDMIDLYDFVEQQSTADAASAQALQSAIEDAVVYEVSGSQRLYSYGLSIYFPFAAKEYFDYCLDIYDDLAFCPEYQTFVADFAAYLVDPAYIAEVPEYEDTNVFEVPDIGQNEDFSEVGSYYVELTNEQIEYLGYVYCTLGWYMDDGTLIDLGDDSDLLLEDTDNGIIIRDDFEGTWTGLNGQPVMLYILDERDDYLIYNVPIDYNGEKAVIKCAWVWDDSYEDNGYYVMNGIFLTNDEYAFPDTRMEVELQVGDVIKPIYPVLYSPDNYDGYYEGNPIVVDENGLTMDLVWLSPGWYQYGFKFIDVYGNGHYSKLVDIEITDQA